MGVSREGPTRRRSDVFGIGWIAVLAGVYLSPALVDGWSFGPQPAASLLIPIQAHSIPPVSDNGDVVTQGLAWYLTNWRLVRAGHFPLWNDLSGTGLPHFLNFESAVLALPSLVGYLAPASVSYLVTVFVKMLIAGTGAYVACRLLGARPIAAALGGTVTMLSGSFTAWLGWAITGPVAWCGWIMVGVIIAYRHRRLAGVVILAVASAFSIYGGMPEMYALITIGLGATLVVTGAAKLATRQPISWGGLGRIAGGLAAGAALSAPLWLPGLAVVARVDPQPRRRVRRDAPLDLGAAVRTGLQRAADGEASGWARRTTTRPPRTWA